MFSLFFLFIVFDYRIAKKSLIILPLISYNYKMKTEKYCIVTTSIDDENIANQISTALLKDHLVACVQSHTVQSKYHWNGTLETSKEILLQMKTKASLFEKIKVQIEALHSYDAPEIIMTPIINANDDYLKWIEKETK